MVNTNFVEAKDTATPRKIGRKFCCNTFVSFLAAERHSVSLRSNHCSIQSVYTYQEKI